MVFLSRFMKHWQLGGKSKLFIRLIELSRKLGFQNHVQNLTLKGFFDRILETYDK